MKDLNKGYKNKIEETKELLKSIEKHLNNHQQANSNSTNWGIIGDIDFIIKSLEETDNFLQSATPLVLKNKPLPIISKKTLKNLKPALYTEDNGEEEIFYRFKEFSDNPGFPENWTIGQESNYKDKWVIRDEEENFKYSNDSLEMVLRLGLHYYI